jgi:hypothetical protein
MGSPRGYHWAYWSSPRPRCPKAAPSGWPW